MQLDDLAARIAALPAHPVRRVIAIAGPPASGKSTLAQHLADAIEGAVAVPMDGFHLDDRLLAEDGSQSRKGAPHTFDVGGLLRMVAALQSATDVIFPLFDRDREIAIAGAGRVRADCKTVIVEGNYLLLNRAPWNELHRYWSLSIALRPEKAVLLDRLAARWRTHGKADAEAWIAANDLPNIETVLSESVAADITLEE